MAVLILVIFVLGKYEVLIVNMRVTCGHSGKVPILLFRLGRGGYLKPKVESPHTRRRRMHLQCIRLVLQNDPVRARILKYSIFCSIKHLDFGI